MSKLKMALNAMRNDSHTKRQTRHTVTMRTYAHTPRLLGTPKLTGGVRHFYALCCYWALQSTRVLV